MIKFEDFTFQYPQSKKPLFNKFGLQLPASSVTLVSGASGSGKSTLLRCINGLVPHFSGGVISGKISVMGKNPIAVGPEEMAKKVGFVFHMLSALKDYGKCGYTLIAEDYDQMEDYKSSLNQVIKSLV